MTYDESFQGWGFFFLFFFFQSSSGWIKEGLSSHTSTYQIHVMCQFNPTLPLQQQLGHVLGLHTAVGSTSDGGIKARA